jgi:valyl-tRNA synthetase
VVSTKIAVYTPFLTRQRQDNNLVFDDAEKRFDLVFSALKTGRSLAASYNLQTDIQRAFYSSRRIMMLKRFAVYFHVQTDDEITLFETQVPTIVALTKGCKFAKVVRDLELIPKGCGSAVLTPTIAVHTLVRVSITEAFINYYKLKYCAGSDRSGRRIGQV